MILLNFPSEPTGRMTLWDGLILSPIRISSPSTIFFLYTVGTGSGIGIPSSIFGTYCSTFMQSILNQP